MSDFPRTKLYCGECHDHGTVEDYDFETECCYGSQDGECGGVGCFGPEQRRYNYERPCGCPCVVRIRLTNG